MGVGPNQVPTRIGRSVEVAAIERVSWRTAELITEEFVSWVQRERTRARRPGSDLVGDPGEGWHVERDGLAASSACGDHDTAVPTGAQHIGNSRDGSFLEARHLLGSTCAEGESARGSERCRLPRKDRGLVLIPSRAASGPVEKPVVQNEGRTLRPALGPKRLAQRGEEPDGLSHTAAIGALGRLDNEAAFEQLVLKVLEVDACSESLLQHLSKLVGR